MALVVQSRDVAVLDLVFKTKAIEFTAKMNVKISKRLMVDWIAAKNDLTCYLQRFLVKIMHVLVK